MFNMFKMKEKIYEIILSNVKSIIEKTVMFNFEKKLLEIINTPNKYNYDDLLFQLEYLTFCSKIFDDVIHETEYYKNNNILDLTSTLYTLSENPSEVVRYTLCPVIVTAFSFLGGKILKSCVFVSVLKVDSSNREASSKSGTNTGGREEARLTFLF